MNLTKTAICICSLFIGCKSANVSQKSIDSVYVKETIYQAVHDTISIENPCDSNGILNKFRATLKFQQGEVRVITKDGKVRIITQIKEIKGQDRYIYKDRIITKEKQVSSVQRFVNNIALMVLILLIAYFILRRFFG